MAFTILIPSNRPNLSKETELSLAPLKVTHIDGTNYPSFSKLINDCIVRCPTETVIICSDKVRPTPKHIETLVSLLDEGFCFVGLYYFACFCFSKELIRTIGFFDERFLGGEYEDADFMVRMREANLAYYVSKEVPYIRMTSSWNNEKSKKHYFAKWQSQNLNEAVRQLPEEKYEYDLGPAIPRKFLTAELTKELQ